MLCPKSALKESQCIRKRLFAFLNFDKKPRLTITHNNEIHFSPRLVAQIPKRKIAIAKISPPFNRL